MSHNLIDSWPWGIKRKKGVVWNRYHKGVIDMNTWYFGRNRRRITLGRFGSKNMSREGTRIREQTPRASRDRISLEGIKKHIPTGKSIRSMQNKSWFTPRFQWNNEYKTRNLGAQKKKGPLLAGKRRPLRLFRTTILAAARNSTPDFPSTLKITYRLPSLSAWGFKHLVL